MLPLFCVTTGISHRVQLAVLVNRPTAEKANFESLIGLVFNLLSVKVFDKNRKI